MLFSGCQKDASHRTLPIHPTVYRVLQAMPNLDREVLDSFFRLLSSDHNFSYTLFGNKPVSLVDYSARVTLGTLYHPNEALIFERGWERWESYAALFPSHEFILKRCKGNKSIGIFLIHKKHTLESISDHLDIFQKILGYHVYPQQLLEQLCDPQQDVMKTLNQSSTLMGILLGYGMTNSADFERKAAICKYLNAKMTPPFSGHREMEALQPASRHLVKCYDSKTFSYPPKDCIASQESSSLADELNNMLARQDTFELYGGHYFLDKIATPIFVARKGTPETKKLHADYLATKQKLHQVDLQNAFLEVTLSQWIDPK